MNIPHSPQVFGVKVHEVVLILLWPLPLGLLPCQPPVLFTMNLFELFLLL